MVKVDYQYRHTSELGVTPFSVISSLRATGVLFQMPLYTVPLPGLDKIAASEKADAQAARPNLLTEFNLIRCDRPIFKCHLASTGRSEVTEGCVKRIVVLDFHRLLF